MLISFYKRKVSIKSKRKRNYIIINSSLNTILCRILTRNQIFHLLKGEFLDPFSHLCRLNILWILPQSCHSKMGHRVLLIFFSRISFCSRFWSSVSLGAPVFNHRSWAFSYSFLAKESSIYLEVVWHVLCTVLSLICSKILPVNLMMTFCNFACTRFYKIRFALKSYAWEK